MMNGAKTPSKRLHYYEYRAKHTNFNPYALMIGILFAMILLSKFQNKKMKKYLILSLLFIDSIVFAQKTTLSVVDFEKKILEFPNAQLVDVRTAEEFLRGHLRKAQNINFNDDNFGDLIKVKLDKTRPVFLYCYSGRRSADATVYLKDLGFRQVFDLEGGFAKWTASSKPYSSSSTTTQPIAALTMENLDRIVRSNQVVLIDFYADWCAPCKKMTPILNKIADENKEIKLLKVDAEKNDNIATVFKIEAIPTYVIIKNARQVWRGEGEMTEIEMKEAIRKFAGK
jgi:thioredoxin 1